MASMSTIPLKVNVVASPEPVEIDGVRLVPSFTFTLVPIPPSVRGNTVNMEGTDKVSTYPFDTYADALKAGARELRNHDGRTLRIDTQWTIEENHV